MAAEGFADYLSGYLAYAVINGIAFVLSFVVTIILIRLILYAVDILTDLPVLGGINRQGELFWERYRDCCGCGLFFW